MGGGNNVARGFAGKPQMSDEPFVLIETRSAPALTRCYPRSFTFYVGNPFPRFVVNELRRASNEGTLRAFRYADSFTTFKIFRRPGALRRRLAPGQSRRSDRIGRPQWGWQINLVCASAR